MGDLASSNSLFFMEPICYLSCVQQPVTDTVLMPYQPSHYDNPFQCYPIYWWEFQGGLFPQDFGIIFTQQFHPKHRTILDYITWKILHIGYERMYEFPGHVIFSCFHYILFVGPPSYQWHASCLALFTLITLVFLVLWNFMTVSPGITIIKSSVIWN